LVPQAESRSRHEVTATENPLRYAELSLPAGRELSAGDAQG
jgi:hypothetical protein